MHPNFPWQHWTGWTSWPLRRLKNRTAQPLKKQKLIIKCITLESTNSFHKGQRWFKIHHSSKDPIRSISSSWVCRVSHFTPFSTQQPEERLTTNYSVCLLKFQTNFSERGSSCNYSLTPLIWVYSHTINSYFVDEVFKSKPAFISMPACLRRALQAQNSNTPEHHICWHIKTGFILIPRSPGLDLHPRSFKALPVGSKSWVLLQRSTFCFLSAGDSLLRMLPCLWQAKQSLDYCTQQPCSTCESLEITLSSPDGSEFTEMARIVLSAKSISRLSARWKVISQKTEKPPQIVLQ